VFTAERIAFNGRSPAHCEPFEVAVVEFDRSGRNDFFSHCKTHYLTYDLYVKAALIVLSHHLALRLAVSSDAPDREWDQARQFVSSRLGYGSDFCLANEA